MLCKNFSPEKSLNNKCGRVSLFFLVCLMSPISCWHVSRLLHPSARLMNELRSLHLSQSINHYFVYLIKKWYIVTFSYEISLLVFNLTPHSYFSLCNFLLVPLTADFMLTIFVFVFAIFPLLSCWISSANNLIWIFVTFVITVEAVSFCFGLFISVIMI